MEEVGHCLQLWDESASCWWGGADYFPLMNNGTFGTCASYPQNHTATVNELWAAIIRNGF